MKKTFATTILAVSLVGLAAPSYAMGWFQQVSSTTQSPTRTEQPTVSNNVPEIDAAGAAIALALLGGVVAIARERRKTKSK